MNLNQKNMLMNICLSYIQFDSHYTPTQTITEYLKERKFDINLLYNDIEYMKHMVFRVEKLNLKNLAPECLLYAQVKSRLRNLKLHKI